MITSKPTPKAKTAIPLPGRTALGLRIGDGIACRTEDGRVVLTRLETRDDAEDPFATVSG